MALDYDVIIVGSGFGGAVNACRLAAAGRKVLVLERGREWHPQDYPRAPDDAWVWDDEAPERHNGWIDFRNFGDMTVVQGAGVGGGSLIYANISVPAPAWIFNDGWPAGIDLDMLGPHYEAVGEMLDVRELPEGQLTERYRLMRDAANALGHGERFTRLPLAVSFNDDWSYDLEGDPFDDRHSKPFVNAHGREQGTCVHCGNCDIGCQVQAKNTLDLNYLASARNDGAEVRPLHLARKLTPLDTGYRVDFARVEGSGFVPGSATAEKVVLAAGSLGSTELLLRCRDEFRTLPKLSERLGFGWSSNGDFLTPAIYPARRVSPTRGPTITCAIDFLDGSQNGQRFFVEDGGFPDVLGNNFGELATRVGHAGGLLGGLFAALGAAVRGSDPVDGLMPWFGQSIDAANGRLRLGASWRSLVGGTRLRLDWDVADSEATIQSMVDMHKAFSEATGGVALEPPAWRFSKDLITPHPLGGCAMADSPRDGVADARGEVFGHPGLYVADSAIVPKAIGLNPSRTIAALAEHVAAGIIANG